MPSVTMWVRETRLEKGFRFVAVLVRCFVSKKGDGHVSFSSLILSLCGVHGRERPVWSCGVVNWIGRPLISPTPSPGHRQVTGPILESSDNDATTSMRWLWPRIEPVYYLQVRTWSPKGSMHILQEQTVWLTDCKGQVPFSSLCSFSHFLFLRHRIMCWPGPLLKG